MSDGFFLEGIGDCRDTETKALRRIAEKSETLSKSELDYIKNWREVTGHGGDDPDDLMGIAISGGGIRSATFALGVLQALAKKDVLRKMDYLSTVSGGGYIGSALTWLTSAQAAQKAGRPDDRFGLEPENFPYGVTDPTGRDGEQPAQDQARLLQYLRHHGNYLTPGAGINLLSLIAITIRGMLLNLLVWVPVMVAVMIALLWISSVLPVRAIVLDAGSWSVEPCPSGPVLCASEVDQITIPVLFLAAILIAFLVAAAFVVACVYYSVRTWLHRGKMHWGKAQTGKSSRRYDLRRFFERTAAIALTLIAVFLVFGSLPLVHWGLSSWLATVGPGAVIAGMASGIWVFLQSQEGGEARKNTWIPMNLVVSVGAFLLIYGLAMHTYVVAFWLLNEGSTQSFYGFTALLAIACITAWCVNLNYISIHRFYRDRLMECFMPDIDQALKNRTGPAKHADAARISEVWNPESPNGPYHIVNTNVVLVDSEDRTWRTRGGDNFILSPLFCGGNATGWCRSNDFVNDGMTLATAMAISGAAANPHTGVGGVGLTRNPMVSILMALLNLRLGYWARHPRLLEQHPPRPNHINPGVYELGSMGLYRKLELQYDEDSKFIQLSDGGHFENLALYELIRRRLKLIVVCDGGADPNFSFSDLQVALRRIFTDFGARIGFDDENRPSRLIARPYDGYPKDSERAKQGHIVGQIQYLGDEKPSSLLIYMKTTMIPGLSMETKGYKGANPNFPDQSTADQFFDEEQFEAYRELGYRIAELMLKSTYKGHTLQEHIAGT